MELSKKILDFVLDIGVSDIDAVWIPLRVTRAQASSRGVDVSNWGELRCGQACEAGRRLPPSSAATRAAARTQGGGSPTDPEARREGLRAALA
eukprot:3144226-Pyramimonas_sp.AAC.1